MHEAEMFWSDENVLEAISLLKFSWQLQQTHTHTHTYDCVSCPYLFTTNFGRLAEI